MHHVRFPLKLSRLSWLEARGFLFCFVQTAVACFLPQLETSIAFFYALLLARLAFADLS